ncbi:GntR family transcriptional regulator [Streptomyces sp. NPDC047081]|uniref:GntR family transcriptional regulator n=1 Tax=Streptomyces sp. NPDC047081 TaxID=3154706 RepID=UPI0033EE1EF2
MEIESDDVQAEQGGAMWAYVRVRDAILSGELPPGQRVSQVQLAERLGIGRPTLREALRMLQNEGLIQAEHNRQVRVAPLELADFEQLCALRLTVEPMAVRLSVPHLTDAELTEIAKADAENARLHKELDFAGAAAVHRCFHAWLFRHAGDRIRRMADDLWRSAERYRRLMVGQQHDLGALAQLADADHAAILRAAQERDGATCADLVAQHISKVSTITLSLIDSTRDPWVLRTAAGRVLEHRKS